MGKGDKKTKRGKIVIGSYGVRRVRKAGKAMQKKAVEVVKAIEVVENVEVVEEVKPAKEKKAATPKKTTTAKKKNEQES